MRLQGPDNCGGFSFDGEEFPADEDGCIDIPDENEAAIVASFSHGFAQCPADDAQDGDGKKRGRSRKAKGEGD